MENTFIIFDTEENQFVEVYKIANSSVGAIYKSCTSNKCYGTGVNEKYVAFTNAEIVALLNKGYNK